MSVTRTGARRSARAAYSPPKPPPRMTTRGAPPAGVMTRADGALPGRPLNDGEGERGDAQEKDRPVQEDRATVQGVEARLGVAVRRGFLRSAQGRARPGGLRQDDASRVDDDARHRGDQDDLDHEQPPSGRLLRSEEKTREKRHGTAGAAERVIARKEH